MTPTFQRALRPRMLTRVAIVALAALVAGGPSPPAPHAADEVADDVAAPAPPGIGTTPHESSRADADTAAAPADSLDPIAAGVAVPDSNGAGEVRRDAPVEGSGADDETAAPAPSGDGPAEALSSDPAVDADGATLERAEPTEPPPAAPSGDAPGPDDRTEAGEPLVPPETDGVDGAGPGPETPVAGPRGQGMGLWQWWDREGLDAAVLYAYANSALQDSIYYAAGFTAVTVSDTLQYSYFVPPRWSLAGSSTHKRFVLEVDTATGEIRRVQRLREESFGQARVLSPEHFTALQLRAGFKSQWDGLGKRMLGRGEEGAQAGGIFDIKLPAMPGALHSIFGDEQSTLSVSGSETISISGTSEWRPYNRTTALSSESKFPDLDMRQNLFLKLQGSIGDKVFIDIDQNSEAETSLENRIKIRYEGYEDEIIQRVNLGNTSLSLPGTRYVSYGGRHEGLFGISSEARLGPVKVSAIASKQESETSTRSVPSTTSSSTRIDDIDSGNYIRRRYYFLDDPNRLVNGSVTYVNGQGMQETYTGEFLFPVNIDPSSIRLYRDDQSGLTDTEQATIDAYVTPTGLPPCACDGAPARCDDTFDDLSDYKVYKVSELVRDREFVVHPDLGTFRFRGLVIELTQPLGDIELLCASFKTLEENGDIDGDGVGNEQIGSANLADAPCGIPTYKMIGTPIDILRVENLQNGPWGPTQVLECKNIYNIRGRNISDLDLDIVWDQQTGVAATPNFEGTPYLQMLGLDVQRLEGVQPLPGHDNEVDVDLLNESTGLLHFPQLRPFAPDEFDIRYRRNILGVPDVTIDAWPDATLTGTVDESTGQLDPLLGNYPEPEIYDNKATVFRLSSDTHVTRYKMRGEFQSPINVIELNAFNILENSEVVTAGSRTLNRGSDYDIDYEFGTVTIRESANVRPDEPVNVTFAFAPTFGATSTTLAGFSASLRPEGGDYGLSSTWLYESKGNPDRRVKLGEEPTRTIIGELAGDYKTESVFLTDLLGRLPLYTPASRSQITMSGAVGLSLPNPNTKDFGYIDTFDDAREARELNLTRTAWKFPSVPTLFLDRDGLTNVEAARRRGRMAWYVPRRATLRGDLNPELSSEERDDAVRVLEWWLLPNETLDDGTVVRPQENWFGLTQSISNRGEDLSTAQFLDVWINDFNNPAVFEEGVMYLDIGQVSEDAVWWRTGPDGDNFIPTAPGKGFGFLDTEDVVTRDGRLDECLDLDVTCNEDTGLDNEFDGTEETDPNFDDWGIEGSRPDEEDDPEANLEAFEFINGTEQNNLLDTEDLNGDLGLDVTDDYFTYRFELASVDTNIVITDIQRDFGDEFDIDPDNGWRRIRIPLGADFEFSREGFPDYTQVKHVRVWFEGIGAAAPIQIATVEFIGNRWQTGAPEAPILNPAGEPADPGELALGQKFAVSVVNNKDNGDIYEPAFDLRQSRDRQGEEFEGYVSLDLLNFPDGYSGTAYRRFAQKQDYTRYDTIEFFTQVGRPSVGDLELEFFIQFGTTDGLNYYEYRKKLRPDDRGGGWTMVEIPIASFSALKQKMSGDQRYIKEIQEDGSWLVVRGSPSFADVRQISLGAKNVSGEFVRSAGVWVNELRLDDVQRNAATASEFRVDTKLSDLGSVNFSYSGQEADFLRVGEVRAGGVKTRSLSFDSSVNVDRFVPRLGLQLPVSYRFSRNTNEPKFRPGTDLIFDGENADLNVTRNSTRRFSVSYSRSPSRNPFLRYTLDGFSGSYSQDVRRNQQPDRADTTRTWNAGINYNFTTPRHRFIPLPLGMQLDYLPKNFSASTSISRSEQKRWSRSGSSVDEPLTLTNENVNKTHTADWRTSYQLLTKPAVNYQFSSSRDLRQEGGKVAGLDLGLETQRTESLSLNHTFVPIREGALGSPLGAAFTSAFNRVVAPFRPNINWSSRFSSRTQISRSDQGFSTRTPQSVENSTTIRTGASIPLSAFGRWLREITRNDPKPADVDSDGEEEAGSDEPRGRRVGGGPRGRSRAGRDDDGQATPGASGRRDGGFGMNVSLLDVNVQYTDGNSNRHSLVDRMPSFSYQLGLTSELDSDIRTLNTNQSRFGDTQNLNLSSGVKLSRIRVAGKRLGASLDVKVTYTDDSSETTTIQKGIDGSISSPTLSISDRTRWPDLQFTLNGLQEGIPFLESRFRRVGLSTRYSRSEDVTGDQTTPDRSVRVTTDWTPLAQFDATLKSGMRVTLKMDRNVGETTNNATSKSIQRDERSSFSLDVQHTINYRRRVKMPFGATRWISTQIDVAGSISIASQKRLSLNESNAFLEDAGLTQSNRDLRVSLDAGYNFTSTVQGNARLQYTENRDNKKISNTRRSLGLTLSASFRF